MFINTPNNYSSMWGELTFEYSCADTTDIVVEIIDATAEETIGVKKFYSSTSAKVNIAPLIFDKMLPDAASTSTFDSSLVLTSTSLFPETGFPQIKLTVGDTESDTLYFTYAKSDIEPPIVLTTMPCDRLLCGDESDQIIVIAPEGSALSISYTPVSITEGLQFLPQTTYSSISGGICLQSVDCALYSDQYKAISFMFYCDGELLGQVNYTLTSEPRSGYRVAWISSRGSIEYYTFPIVVDETLLSSGATTKSLRSAYGTAEEIEALSEIISSPRVWRVDGDTCTEIEVLTTEQMVRQEGALMIANIKILENG